MYRQRHSTQYTGEHVNQCIISIIVGNMASSAQQQNKTPHPSKQKLRTTVWSSRSSAECNWKKVESVGHSCLFENTHNN